MNLSVCQNHEVGLQVLTIECLQFILFFLFGSVCQKDLKEKGWKWNEWDENNIFFLCIRWNLIHGKTIFFILKIKVKITLISFPFWKIILPKLLLFFLFWKSIYLKLYWFSLKTHSYLMTLITVAEFYLSIFLADSCRFI